MRPDRDGARRREPLRFRHAVMGTVASVRVHDTTAADAVDRAVAAAFDELDRIERVFSTFSPTSSISRINQGRLDLLDAAPEVLEVLDACTWLEHESGGAFRARRPDPPNELDPAGFVKGWAGEHAAALLRDAGLEHWWLGLGGDIVVSGSPTDRRAWQVAIADPCHDGEIVGVFDLHDGGAVATSGSAERGEHVWDGRDGSRARSLASVTVLGPELAWADAFATAAFAMGRDGPDWVAQFDGYHALGIDHDGGLLPSSELVLEPTVPAAGLASG